MVGRAGFEPATLRFPLCACALGRLKRVHPPWAGVYSRKLYQAELPPDWLSFKVKEVDLTVSQLQLSYLAFLHALSQSAPQIMAKASVDQKKSINILTASEAVSSNILKPFST